MSTYINSGMDKPLPAEEKAMLQKQKISFTLKEF
jgi:hypothetical protein